MHRITWILAPACAALLLGACSHKDANAPLAHVPADTPYVTANLKPIDADTRGNLLQDTGLQRSMQARSLNDTADSLAKDGKEDLADLLHYVADYLDNNDFAAIAADSGINPNGLFALYGLGLSPVARGQLDNADKFHAWVGKFAKAYGHKLQDATAGDVSYQHMKLGDSQLQLLIATHHQQFVIAALPTDAADDDLRMALGVDTPDTSLADNKTLQKLASANGYKPYQISYLDTTKLPGLLAGSDHPLLGSALSHLRGDNADDNTSLPDKLPASCKSDLARIAARVPRISAGYTQLKAKQQTGQVDFELAPDIVDAFSDMGTNVPGLGDPAHEGVLDFAMALPTDTVRDFWLQQAEAIQDKPFECPALTSLNDQADRAAKVLPKLNTPPLGALRGLRIAIDQLDNGDGKPDMKKDLQARALVASSNPNSLVRTVQALVPGFKQMDLKTDGKPVSVPKNGKPNSPDAWAAMNDGAVAVGIGKGEKDSLPDMLDADTGDQGSLYRVAIDGETYAQWLQWVQKKASAYTDRNKDGDDAGKKKNGNQADTKMSAQMQDLQQAMKHLRDIHSSAHMTDDGLRIQSRIRRK